MNRQFSRQTVEKKMAGPNGTSYFRNGVPIQVVDLKQRDQPLSAVQILEECVSSIQALEAQILDAPELATDEIRQEVKWAQIEIAVAEKNSSSRFFSSLLSSCNVHVNRAKDAVDKLKMLQSTYVNLDKNLTAIKRMMRTAQPAFSLSMESDLCRAASQLAKAKTALHSPQCSSVIMSDHICQISERLIVIYSAIMDHSNKMNVAREAKSRAIVRFSNTEGKYESACDDLNEFLQWHSSFIQVHNLLYY